MLRCSSFSACYDLTVSVYVRLQHATESERAKSRVEDPDPFDTDPDPDPAFQFDTVFYAESVSKHVTLKQLSMLRGNYL